MSNFSASSVERCMKLLELLVDHSSGLSISAISQKLALPLSATHRLLQALVASHYVKQEGFSDRYVPTLRLSAMGLRLLASTNITQVCQPPLDELARHTGELVRLAVVDGEAMNWVAKAQGATGSFRYDPINGQDVSLHTTAMGKIWLASMPEDKAIALVEARGFDNPLVGPRAVKTVEELRRAIRVTRKLGFGLNEQESEIGLSAIAMLVVDHNDPHVVLGAVSIGGLSFKLDRQRLLSFVEPLRAAVQQISLLWPLRAYLARDAA